jgi:anti-sigma factor RsiW
MIDCPNGAIRDQLPDFVHDQLNAAARAAVAAHVASCGACAAELALLRELRGTLRSGPAVDIARIVAALPASSRVQSGVRRGGWRRLDWRIAASVAALAVGGSEIGRAHV